MSPSHMTLSRTCARSLTGGALIVAFAFAGSPPANAARVAKADCPRTGIAPTVANTVQIRASILCLTNAARTHRGLVALRENPRLRRAARAHSADMLDRGYFAHTSPEGDTFVDRIRAARYIRHGNGWSLGENLAWGTGERATARDVHDAWMGSSGHRSNILQRAYRELGIGVRVGTPGEAGIGATYTIEFGVKL